MRGSLLQQRIRMPSASTGLRKRTSNRNCYSPQKSSAISLRWDYMHRALLVGVAALGSDSDAMWLCQPTNGCFLALNFHPKKERRNQLLYIFSFSLFFNSKCVKFYNISFYQMENVKQIIFFLSFSFASVKRGIFIFIFISVW